MDTKLNLNANEVRVLGVLMEKEMTTPEYYPMTPNALRNGCNQKSNRYPVVTFDDDIIRATLDSLRSKQLVYIVSTHGSRTRKYEHRLKDKLHLTKNERALLCVLMLRGFQTIGEMRGRTDRMTSFESLEAVEEAVEDMMRLDRQPMQLVRRLERMPGQKDNRYAHLLSGDITEEQLAAQPVQIASSSSSRNELIERVTELENQVKELKEEFSKFKQQFE